MQPSTRKGIRAHLRQPSAALTLLLTIGLAAISSQLPAFGQPQPQPASSPREPKAEQRKPRVDQLGDPLPDGVLARMGSSRLRHGGHVHTLAFSPDGKSIVSAGGRVLRIWDAATGKQRRRFDVDTDWTLSFAFTADGIAVASAGFDKGIVTVQVIDPASGKVRRHAEMPDRATVAQLTFSPGGKQLAYTHDNTVRLCDPVAGREILRIPVKGRLARDMVFAPDGKTIAICDISDTVHLHDTTSGKIVRELKRTGDTVVHLAFSPDGRFLASIAWNEKQKEAGEMSIWDVTTGKECQRLKSPHGHVLHAAFSPDGKYVATGCQHRDLIVWDTATGKEVRRYPTDAYFSSIAFSPDGKALAAASGEGTIRLWETASGRVLPGSADPFLNAVHHMLRFSADGRRLLGNAAVHVVWDAATGRELRRFPKVSDRGWLCPLSPDESLLASTDDDGTIQLWNAATGEKVRTFKGHEKWVRSLVFAADSRRLFSSGLDGTIRVWDVASGRQLRKLIGRGELAASPDSRWLASDSGSNILLWDLTTGEQKAQLQMASQNSPSQKVFSPDSRLLAAVNGGPRRNDPGEVKVWDVATGKEWRSFDGHKTRGGSVAFSPDGRMLATGDMSGVLFLWELATGHRRHQFIGHESWIYSLAFSPNGRMLAASSNEAPVFVWDVAGTTESMPRPLANDELQRCWTALAGADAPTAFQAIRRLVATPEQTLPLLREHLKPVPAPDLKRVRQLVKALDSDEFAERQKAADELGKRADAAASLLRQTIEDKPSLYVRRTLQQILDSLETTPETLRAVRAVEVLESIATPDAVRLVGELAKGTADARLTREAAAARTRLRRASTTSPGPSPKKNR